MDSTRLRQSLVASLDECVPATSPDLEDAPISLLACADVAGGYHSTLSWLLTMATLGQQ